MKIINENVSKNILNKLNEDLAEDIKNKDNTITIINQFGEEKSYNSVDEAISEYEDLVIEFETEEDEESALLAQDILDELYDLK